MLKLIVFCAFFLFIRSRAQEDIDYDEAFNPIKINEAFMKIPELSNQDINILREAVQNNEQLLLLFHAGWCQACHDFKPVINLMYQNSFFKSNGISVYSVNVDKNVEGTARLFIVNVPTIIHILNGEVRDISKFRWKLVDYFEDKKWNDVKPRSRIWHPFGILASLLGLSTRYGHFISKEAQSLAWPKWKWCAVFFSCFALAWLPAIYLGIFSKSHLKESVMDRTAAADHDDLKEE